MDALTTAEFDYALLGDKADALKLRAAKIRKYEQTTFDSIVAAGRELREAKRDIPHGLFGKWAEAEFPHWSRDTATRYMRIAEAHQQNPQIAEIGISALHELLKPDVAPEAIAEAIDREQSGRHVTVAAAREIAERYTEPADEAEPADEPEADEADEPDEEFEPSDEGPSAEPAGVFTELRRVFDRMTISEAKQAEMLLKEWRIGKFGSR